MNWHPKTICRLVAVIIVLLMPGAALAGTYTQTFYNEFQTDSIYPFLYDDDKNHDVIFQSVDFTDASWSIATSNSENTYLQLSGPVVDPGALQFDITFTGGPNKYRIPSFTLEWAEYLNGVPSASDAMGAITLDRKGGSYSWIVSNDFNSTVPTPLPASTWLLLSGLFFLVGVRRHTRG